MLNRYFNAEHAVNQICGWIRSYVNGAGKTDVVLGLSGGCDSAVVGALAIRTLGKEHVHLVALPCESSKDSLLHAQMQADAWKMPLRIEDLTESFHHQANNWDFLLYSDDDKMNALIRGNTKARMRMVFQYAWAQNLDALVIGTGNKSEESVGYATKFGDNAADLFPIGAYYKTEVWEIAKYLRDHTYVPVITEIIDKAPSADLWAGQTDVDEMGLPSYGVLDNCLCWLFGETAVDNAPITNDQIARVHLMVVRSKHKNEVVPVCPRF